MDVIAKAARAQSLVSLVAQREKVAAAAHFLVVGPGAKGVVAASVAAIFGMPFDCVDPFGDLEVRATPSMLLAVSPREPSDAEIADMARLVMRRAPGSIVVIEARGRGTAAYAAAIRAAHPEIAAVAERI